MAGTSAQLQQANQRAMRRSTEALAQTLGGIGIGGKSGLADVGVEVTNLVKKKLSQRGTGRVYRRGGVYHQASAPGQPPAVDTGQLRASYNWRTGTDARGPYVEIGTNLETGPWLEFGTRYMEARPALRPSIEEFHDQITARIREGIIREQRGILRRLPRIFS